MSFLLVVFSALKKTCGRNMWPFPPPSLSTQIKLSFAYKKGVCANSRLSKEVVNVIANVVSITWSFSHVTNSWNYLCPGPTKKPTVAPLQCNVSEWMCADQKLCIDRKWICDAATECDDGSDEANCGEIYWIRRRGRDFISISIGRCWWMLLLVYSSSRTKGPLPFFQ